MVDRPSPNNGFSEFINELNKIDKCCFIDSASVISGLAKFLANILKQRDVVIDLNVFIWFVGILFLQVLKNEKETHGNKAFVCVIRECSIIPKVVMDQLKFKDNTHYICKLLGNIKGKVEEVLGDDCIFKVIGADTKCNGLAREVDDALCIHLSSLVEKSHILTCDGYDSFRKTTITYSDIVIKKRRSGNKFKPIASLSDVVVTSRRCHSRHAKTFREAIRDLVATTNYEAMYATYVESITAA